MSTRLLPVSCRPRAHALVTVAALGLLGACSDAPLAPRALRPADRPSAYWSYSQTRKFSITELPAVAGAAETDATSINDAGQVVGIATMTDGTHHAVLWEKGTARVLPDLTSGGESSAADINRSGQIVGWSKDAIGQSRAVRWVNGVILDLGDLGTDYAIARGINDAGQIVGTSTIAGSWAPHAFMWQNGVMRDLGTLPGGNVSEAYDINDAGQVVGYSDKQVNGPLFGFVSQNGVLQELPGFGGTTNWLFAINKAGQAVGYGTTLATATEGTSVNAALWEAPYQQVTDLDVGYAIAYGINDAGQIVGHSSNSPVLWDHGTATWLPGLANRSGAAKSINTAGVIAGAAYTADYKGRAVLWTELPSTLAVGIDVQPGQAPNGISLKKLPSTIPVALLGSATFDVTQVDPATLTLGDEQGTDTPIARSKTGTLLVNPPMDVNADGRPDLIVYFATSELSTNGDIRLTAGTSYTLVLRGATKAPAGRAVRGTDQLAVNP